MSSPQPVDLAAHRIYRDYSPRYGDAIQRRCPNIDCQAAPGELCTNPHTGLARRLPCIARVRTARPRNGSTPSQHLGWRPEDVTTTHGTVLPFPTH